MEVQILLQPNVARAGEGTPHRFLVQAATLGAGRTANFTKEEWSELGKDKIQEHRLSVLEIGGGGSLQEKYDNLVR